MSALGWGAQTTVHKLKVWCPAKNCLFTRSSYVRLAIFHANEELFLLSGKVNTDPEIGGNMTMILTAQDLIHCTRSWFISLQFPDHQ